MAPVARGRCRGAYKIVRTRDRLAPLDVLTRAEPLRVTERLLDNKRDCLEWLSERRLIANYQKCARCRHRCTLTIYKRGSDGFRWQCNHCRYSRSIRAGSFFNKRHLSLKTLVCMMHAWANDVPLQDAMKLHGIKNWRTACKLNQALRAIVTRWLALNPQPLGGLDVNLEPITVEVDESRFFYRHQHRGRYRRAHWVFGAVERKTRRCFMVDIPRRNAATMFPLIEQNILPGTHIVTDNRPVYDGLAVLAQGVYSHSAINHRRNFLDPTDPNIHTQNIDNLWMLAKRKLKHQTGTSHRYFPYYIKEYMWRSQNKKHHFEHLINCIATVMPV